MAPITLKWGIAGCGRRSRDFAVALAKISQKEHLIVAVASRGEESIIKDFIAAVPWHPMSYTCYSDLAYNKEINVVYVGTSIPTRCKVAEVMMRHNKHVVIESPLCIHPEEMEALTKWSHLHKVIMIEACVPKFSPLIGSLKEKMTDFEIGELEGIVACLGKPLYLVEYGVAEMEKGGGVGFRITHYLLKIIGDLLKDMPDTVTISGEVDADGVCTQMQGVFLFNNVYVNFTCTITADSPNEITLIGTKGYCKLKDVLDGPISVETSTLLGNKVTFDSLALDSENYTFKGNSGFKYVIEEVAGMICSGNFESELLNHQNSRRSVYLLSTLHDALGNVKIPKLDTIL